MAPADTATLAALRRQSELIAAIFDDAGYQPVAPEILQPADIFLDRYGEDIRARTYVFTDPDGAELCLRPDLTIPTCRLYLARGEAGGEARYRYDGPAFRYHPAGGGRGRTREFQQAGVESFGVIDRARVDAELIALAVRAVEAAGLEDYSIHLGDLGLFSALVDGVGMPSRWRTRLKDRFWRPRAFRTLLARLAGEEVAVTDARHGAILERVADCDRAGAIRLVDRILGEEDIPLVGGRGLDEIAGRLLEQSADRRADPLYPEVTDLIRGYLAVEAPPRAAVEAIAALDASLDGALEGLARRFDLLEAHGIDLGRCLFSAEFGRNLEYYTGSVFQLEVPGVGPAGQIAGGGRYDGMLSDLGAAAPVPAAGLAIHTERLLAAVNGGAS